MKDSETLRIVISGGTGFIGTALVSALAGQGHRITLLIRKPLDIPRHFPAVPVGLVKTVLWDGGSSDAGIPQQWWKEVDGTDAVINLAGESIGSSRWSDSRKSRIRNSRINSTSAIVHAIAAAQSKPGVLISGSAVGYYGNVIDGDVTEEHGPQSDFLSKTCVDWEREAHEIESAGIRLILLRTGIVLEKDGGALQKLLLPFGLFVGGPLGPGRQWMPWIHRDDVVRIIQFALESDSLSGPVNLVAPHPVTMNAFAATLGRVLHRPSWARVPGFVLEALLGEMSLLVLGGQRAIPQKLVNAGFQFKFETLEPALSAILKH